MVKEVVEESVEQAPEQSAQTIVEQATHSAPTNTHAGGAGGGSVEGVGGNGAASGGGGGPAGDPGGTTSLWRAVGPNEFDDIMETGMFRPHPGGRSMEAKQFGLDFDEILTLSDQLPGTAAIVRVDVPTYLLQYLDDVPVEPSVLRSGSVTVQPNLLDLFNSSLRGPRSMYIEPPALIATIRFITPAGYEGPPVRIPPVRPNMLYAGMHVSTEIVPIDPAVMRFPIDEPIDVLVELPTAIDLGWRICEGEEFTLHVGGRLVGTGRVLVGTHS